MVASSVRFWQDFADGNFPTLFHRQYWHEAVAQVAENHTVASHTGERLTKALTLVLAHAVAIKTDDTAHVRSGNQTYTITQADGCTCEDARRRTRFCKHALAVLMHRRATALLQNTQQANSEKSSKESTASIATRTATCQVNEAAVSCTLTFTCNDVDVQLTMRDVSDDALFVRVRRVLPKLQQKMQKSGKGRKF